MPLNGNRNSEARLARESDARLGSGLALPEPIRLLFGWIEANRFYVDTPSRRIGYLSPSGGCDGTRISFAVGAHGHARSWLASDDPGIMHRLRVFARTGSDGSAAAFWLADDGSQKIVHLGSGSGSTMVCVLANEPIDFLRLLAIGYDEICWGEELFEPPNVNAWAGAQSGASFVDWLVATFATTIPKRGTDIVKYPISIDAPSSPDPFWQWVKRLNI